VNSTVATDSGLMHVSRQSPYGTVFSSTSYPQQPRLAPGVTLAGELRETGFQDRQWLIQRNGSFIQLTELLYRVAEQVDGSRTLAEIAEALSATTDWLVTPDQVGLLVQKLIPLGLILPAEGAPAPSGPSMRSAPSSSPLGMSMKLKAVGPNVIHPVTDVLAVLYAPPVLVLMLLAIVAGQGWFFTHHALSQSITAVLVAPNGMVTVVGIMLIASVVHEFGHATALRAAGGSVRAMGVGFLFIYPAFYTDTTDAYRLGRWARVRTDLGGFYFHLLFALGLMGLYQLTGINALLVAALLIDLDVLYQSVPFVRMDGYWALADLTGIPDFFSQMRPFLASVLPVPGWQGTRLPPLRPWARAVFFGYFVLIMPILALLIIAMLWQLPWLFEAGRTALPLQTTYISRALQGGEPLGVLSPALQMLFLILPVIGIGYMAFRFTLGLVRGVTGL
jgi:putative peptide zinc metalloprotease protein